MGKQMKTLTQGGTTYDIKDATALPLDGSAIMTGTLIMQKADNGRGEWYKNHSAVKDSGTVMVDKDVNGNSARLAASARDQKVYAAFSSDNSIYHELFGQHNTALLNDNIKHNIKTYTDLSQLGITVGSETIANIVAAMPNGSQLLLAVTTNHNAETYPSQYGTLLAVRATNVRTMFYFLANNGFFYTGAYQISSTGTESWTGWIRMARNSDVCNPNLLVNGNFKVWQRGTSFTDSSTSLYTADRWMRKTKNMMVKKTNAGLSVYCGATATSLSITQTIDDFYNKLSGKVVTASCKIRNISGTWKMILAAGSTSPTAFDNTLGSTTINATGDHTFTVTINTDLSAYKYVGISLYSVDSATTNSIEILSCKLEYGYMNSAHYFDSEAEELLRCQRYYYKPVTSTNGLFSGYLNANCTQIGFGVPCPVTMRAKPTIKIPSVVIRTISGLSPLTPGGGTNLYPDTMTFNNDSADNMMFLAMQMNDSRVWANTSLANTPCTVATNAELAFDAEIY